jgi:hypothetical protein
MNNTTIHSVSREALLEAAFRDLPQTVAGIQLRPMSAGSWVLLNTLGNSLVAGVSSEADGKTAVFAAIYEYLWIHSAPIERVAEINHRDDLPAAEIRALGFQVPIGNALAFLETYKESALRFAAAMTEPEEANVPGQPGKLPESRLVGSPPSVSPSGPPVTLSGSDTSSGKCQSSAPSLTSMPPMSQTELPVDGPAMILDHPAPEPAPSSSSSTNSESDTTAG